MSSVIRGAGGGGGGGKGGDGGASRQPVEAADSLASKATARVLDAVCEGEIEGLVGGAKGVYLDETALQNPDNSYNFQNVVLETRTGTQAQTYIPGFADTEIETSVNVQVTYAAAAVRNIATTNVNRARVTVGVPGLLNTNPSTGDVNGASLSVIIEVQPNGGVYTTIVNDTISGKTRSRYQRSYEIPLAGTGPWNVRVSRGEPESTTVNLVNALWWDTLTTILDTKFTYPNTAMIGLQVDATQFNTVPQRAYKMKLLKVRIPSNYNPTTRVYTGVWDGTFQVAWTNNPAWCFYDLVTNTRYGLGAHVPATLVDKWNLYTIGQYCDQFVSDGSGGTEPRFTLNVFLQTREQAVKVINDLASVFRGMAYWGLGSLYATQDAPSDPVALFTAANVLKGEFAYEGSARKARHTVCVVQYNDPLNFYKLMPEYIEGSAAMIARYGIREKAIVAFGCASRGQANRVGRWILYTEEYESDVISFGVGMDASYLTPGNIIKIADPDRAGARMGGRVISATTTSITIDAPVTISTGITYTLSVVMPGGTLETRVLTNGVGATSVLTFAAVLPSVDIVGAVWLLAASNLAPVLARVLAVTEESPTELRVHALQHYSGKYALVETGLQLQTIATTRLSPIVAAPTGLVVEQELYIDAATLKVRLVARWTAVPGAVAYSVMWRRANGNWTILPNTNSVAVQVDDVTPDTYEVKVQGINPVGGAGLPVTGTASLLGKLAKPADVTGFSAQQNGNVVAFKWNQVADLDLQGYEIRYNDFGQTGWDDATPLTSVTRGTAVTTAAIPPSPAGGPWNLMIKAKDTSGLYSTNAAVVALAVSSALDVVYEKQHYPDWLGCTLTSVVKHWNGTIVPDSQNLASADGWETFDKCVPNPVLIGSVTAPEYDQGFDNSVRVWSDIVSALCPGETSGLADPRLYVDYHVAAGAYDGFESWTIGEVVLRKVKQKFQIETSVGIAKVTGFRTVCDALEYTDGGTAIATTGGYVQVFNKRFVNTPRITVTAAAGAGGTFRLATWESVTTTQFTVRVFNDAGIEVGGSFTWEATGV